ncbi:DNA alkylation repair protein [Pirellulaceae bacterium SH467]
MTEWEDEDRAQQMLTFLDYTVVVAFVVASFRGGRMSRDSFEEWKDRKPARRMVEVPDEVRAGLSLGRLESKNLVEWLSVDRVRLLQLLIDELSLPITDQTIQWIQNDTQELAALKKSQWIGAYLATVVHVGDDAWKSMSLHTSDVVREWAALIVGHAPLSFLKKLAWIKLFADDDNPGLREIAWISLRGDVLRDTEECIRRMVPWTGSRNERLRRFASELTRPRGVWTFHIEQLKRNPELAIQILEPLKEDDSKYVKDSVANWLNDASKTKPDWVVEITDRWNRESDSPHTQYIIRRALRTLRGKA